MAQTEAAVVQDLRHSRFLTSGAAPVVKGAASLARDRFTCLKLNAGVACTHVDVTAAADHEEAPRPRAIDADHAKAMLRKASQYTQHLRWGFDHSKAKWLSK